MPAGRCSTSLFEDWQARIDEIVNQARQQVSLAVAISGLNSIRHTLDSVMYLPVTTGRRALRLKLRSKTIPISTYRERICGCRYSARASIIRRLEALPPALAVVNPNRRLDDLSRAA